MIFKAVNPLFWFIFSKTCISPRRNYHFWGFWEFPNQFDLTCFDVVFKAVNPLFWCIFSKTSISPRRNYHFWGLWEFSKYSIWHVLIPVLVTATLRVLPRTFADLDCLRYNASTTWTHGKFQRTYNSVAWRMSGKFQRTYGNVAWRMSGKFQRTYNSVAWRMSGKFQRTYREACPSSASSHERYCMPHPTPPHPCIHAPTGSHRQACPSSASSHERYYMPHPTPPMCTKHHGLLKAVVQLIWLVICLFASLMFWP